MSFGPTNYRQGGTRGGADQFKWEDVKNDKYRENYLGHSLQAPVGRWQKGKDLTWYTKLNKDDRAAALKEEIALAKQRDRELMDQALGIAPKKRAEPAGQLDASEVKELLKRGASDRDGLDGERVEGLGAAPVPHEFSTGPKKTLAQKYEENIAAGREEDDIYALRGSAGGGSDRQPRTEKEERALRKALKKQKKKEKKAKKEKRKEKKREKRHRSDSSDSDDDYDHRRGERGRSLERLDKKRSPRRHSPSPSRSPSVSRFRSRHDDRRSRSVSRGRGRRSVRDSRDRSRSRSRSRLQPRTRSRSRSHSRGRRRRDRDSPRRRSYSRDRS